RLADVLERRGAEHLRHAVPGPAEAAGLALEVLGEALHVAAHDRERRRAYTGLVVAVLEAGEALAHVVGEAGLAHLAVVHAVDSAFNLPAHGLGDGTPEARRERGAVVRLAARPRDHHRPEVRGPGQGAGVGREDAVGAPDHDLPCAVFPGSDAAARPRLLQ